MKLDRVQDIMSRIETLEKRFGVEVLNEKKSFEEILNQEEQKIELPSPQSNSSKTGDSVLETLKKVAGKYNISPDLIRSMIKVESNYDPDAVSDKGAKGLMQLMDSTSSSLGVNDPFDIEENIDGGTRHIKNLLEKYNADLPKALAAYNAGEVAVDKTGDIPDYPETRDYIERVLSELDKYQNSGNK